MRFVDHAKNKRLGRDLKWPFLSEEEKAISNGMMAAEAIFEAVRKSIFPPVQKDRYLAEEIERLTQWIARGQLVALANEHVALSE